MKNTKPPGILCLSHCDFIENRPLQCLDNPACTAAAVTAPAPYRHFQYAVPSTTTTTSLGGGENSHRPHLEMKMSSIVFTAIVRIPRQRTISTSKRIKSRKSPLSRRIYVTYIGMSRTDCRVLLLRCRNRISLIGEIVHETFICRRQR